MNLVKPIIKFTLCNAARLGGKLRKHPIKNPYQKHLASNVGFCVFESVQVFSGFTISAIFFQKQRGNLETGSTATGESLKKRYAVGYSGWTPVRGVTIDGVYRVDKKRTYRIL